MGSNEVHPAYGRQEVQFLPDGGVLIHGTEETVKAHSGEDLCGFVERLREEHGVSALDRVVITYQGGMPKLARIRWRSARDERGRGEED